MEKRLPLAVGTVLQGHYRILRQLGHGGFGAVYEAVDDDLKLSFALKETFYAADEDLRNAFKREARMLASLSHEAFPRVTHYFTEGDGCFLVMELIHGDDLDKLLSHRVAPFEQEQILVWADQILDALEDLHERKIIHRDIKPSNLKLTPKGKIKLLDFGIAKGALEGETTILTTVGSLAAATLQYAPIEQVLKASQQHQMMLSVVSADKVMESLRHGTDAASDLYALAATLYQLLTKQLPADAPTRAIAVWSGQADRLIPAHQVNPNVSVKVSDVLQKAMRLDKSERYQTAAEMRRILKEVVKPNPPANFVLPETVKAVENFVPPPVQNPPPVQAESFQPNLNTEVTRLRQTLQPVLKPKKSFGSYAAVIGLPLLILTFIGFGLFFFTNLSTKFKPSPLKGNFELTQTLTAQNGELYDLQFSPDGKTFLSSGYITDVLIWSTSNGLIKETLSSANSSVRSTAFSHNGNYFAFSKKDYSGGKNNLIIRRTDSGSEVIIFSTDSVFDPIEQIKFSPDDNFIYYVQEEANVVKSYKIPTLGGKPELLNFNLDKSVFSPDGRFIASANEANKQLIIRETASGNQIQALSLGNTDLRKTTAFSPDGKMFAADDGYTGYRVLSDIDIWEISSGEKKSTLKGEVGVVSGVVFSPDGKVLASGNSSDKTIKIWDAANGNLLQTLTGHNDSIVGLAFSPDGKTLISSSLDNTIKVWSLK